MTSYFSNKPGYITIFNELLRDWEFKKSTIPALLKLIDDADSSREIKKRVQEYGAEKVILPDCKIMPSALLLPPNIPAPEYRPVSSLKELTLLTILKQIELCKDEKDKYDIGKLQEIFGTSPRGLLEIMFEYPDFPENLKKPILEAAYLEYKKNVKSPIKEDFKSTLLHKEDYKTESYNLLKKFMKLKVINNELREKINMHIFMQDLPYDKKEIGELFDVIVSLPKIDGLSKKKIFLHVAKIRFGGKFQPLNLLEEAMRYFSGGDYYGILWNECGFKQYPQLYTWVINYTFQQYPFYTAKKLINLAKKASNLEEKKTAIAFVDVHKLLQKVIDSDQTIMQNGMQDLEFCELLLFNGVKFSQEVIHEAIKADDIKLLMLLREYGIDFSDPALIKTALGTKSLNALSFLVGQQKNISQKNKNRILKIVCEQINTEWEENAYKLYWHTKFTKNALPLEALLIDKARLEHDTEKKQKILTKVKEICRKITWDDIEKLEDMDKIIVKLSSVTLLKDKDFLKGVLKEVTFKTNDISRHLDDHIEKLNEEKSVFTFCAELSAYALGSLDITNFIEPTESMLLNGLQGLMVLSFIGFGGLAFYIYPEYVDTYNKMKKRIHLYERFNYLEGYIRGLFEPSDKSDKIIRPQEKIKILDKISKTEIIKILYTFSSNSLFVNILSPIDKLPIAIRGPIWGGCLFNTITNAFFVFSSLYKHKKHGYSKAKELIQSSLNSSKAEGFLDGLLYAKNCQNELPCNSDFYEGDNVFPQFVLEKWRKNSQKSQEFEKLAQSCKQKVKSGFFKKCMNYIMAGFYNNKDLANKLERGYSNSYLKIKNFKKESKFTTLIHNILPFQSEL